MAIKISTPSGTVTLPEGKRTSGIYPQEGTPIRKGPSGTQKIK